MRLIKEELDSIIGEIYFGSISILGCVKKNGVNRNTLRLWMTRRSGGSLPDKSNTTMLPSKEESKKTLD